MTHVKTYTRRAGYPRGVTATARANPALGTLSMWRAAMPRMSRLDGREYVDLCYHTARRCWAKTTRASRRCRNALDLGLICAYETETMCAARLNPHGPMREIALRGGRGTGRVCTAGIARAATGAKR